MLNQFKTLTFKCAQIETLILNVFFPSTFTKFAVYTDAKTKAILLLCNKRLMMSYNITTIIFFKPYFTLTEN